MPEPSAEGEAAEAPEPEAPEPAFPEPEFLNEVTAWGGFDPAWYLHRYPDIANYPYGPMIHFCTYGLFELRDPSPHVSLAAYLRRSPPARDTPLPALIHALRTVPSDRRQKAWQPEDEESLAYLVEQHGLFDEAWYLARYRDVALSGLRPIQHFVRHGAGEHRDPGPAFDSDFYTDRYPDYQTHAHTPIEHFIRFGRPLGHLGVGSPKYQRWLEAFDTLTPDDRERIAKLSLPMAPAMVAVHVIDDAAMSRIADILHRWDAQIGVECRVRLIRGSDVGETAWDACRAEIAGHPRISLANSDAILADLEGGTAVLLCGGAVLARPHTAFMLLHALGHSGAEAAYGDHDHIDEAGVRTAPIFKPAMSPEFMRRLPYAGSVIAAILNDATRSRLVAAVEAAVSGDAAQAWAGYLLTLAPKAVERVPFLVFHRPGPVEVETFEPVPTGSSVSPFSDTLSSSERIRVSIVIPTRDHSGLLRDCLESLQSQTDYPPDLIDIVIVDNGSVEDATHAYFLELSANPRVTLVPSPGPFNFSHICNAGAAVATGDLLVFLNNDMTVCQRDWLTKLVQFAGRPDVGVVGAQLLYPDGTVQHGGVVLGVQGVGAHRLVGLDGRSAGRIDVTREMASVTGACLAIRRSLFVQLGGFDPVLQVAFNDVKLCASAWEAGYRNIYVAEPLFYHHESKSRGFDSSPLQQRRNLREAIYVRERYADLFRDDPSYSPNLSLKQVGDLAVAPRVVRPWRRSTRGVRRALLLSRVHGLGHGVAIVLDLQAQFLRRRGWEVTVGGPTGDRDMVYAGCHRVGLWTAEAAAAFTVSNGIDCVVAHTPPFFSITRILGRSPPVYFVDHGEPPPRLFPDWKMREQIDWEKRFCAPLAKRVFAISQAVFRQQYRGDVIVIRNGNSHLATWSEEWAARRRAIRKRLGFEGCFVVLSVSRFGPGELLYKGIRRYGEVASDTPFRHAALAGRFRCVIAGRGDEADVAEVEAMGLTAFANLPDQDLVDLYAASDLYLSLSEWEGYNLGIGQALAMGLDAIASNIDAHREFGIETADSVPDLCDAIARRHAAWDEQATHRRPTIEPWDVPLTTFAETTEADVTSGLVVEP